LLTVDAIITFLNFHRYASSQKFGEWQIILAIFIDVNVSLVLLEFHHLSYLRVD
jgi:hypothetical protein